MVNPCDSCKFGDRLTNFEAGMLRITRRLKGSRAGLIDAVVDYPAALDASVSTPDDAEVSDQEKGQRIDVAAEHSATIGEAIDFMKGASAAANEINCFDPRYKGVGCPKMAALKAAQIQFSDILNRQLPGNG